MTAPRVPHIPRISREPDCLNKQDCKAVGPLLCNRCRGVASARKRTEARKAKAEAEARAKA
jgi:hypothetical protein